MTKMIDNVKAEFTGNRKMGMGSLRSILITNDVPCPLGMSPELKEYVAHVEWVAKFYCDPENLQPMLESIIRELREAIYGELKERIIRLERAVYEEDRDKIVMEIRDIIREIYG